MTDVKHDKPKQVRRKRRIPGSSTPPRKEFSLRIEAALFERLTKLLATFGGSRNEYIERLIDYDLAYRDRIETLNRPFHAAHQQTDTK